MAGSGDPYDTGVVTRYLGSNTGASPAEVLRHFLIDPQYRAEIEQIINETNE